MLSRKYLNYDECYALIKKLKSNINIPKNLIDEFEDLLSLQKEIIFDLNDIALKYEGDEGDSSFEKLENSLKNFRIQEDLAKTLQSVIFPSSLPNNSLLSVNVKFCPMGETSGDFYDIAEIVPGSVYGIFLADIAGHGVSAALITNLAKMLFLNAIDKFSSPKDTLEYINIEICNILNYRSYFTSLYVIADFPNKRIIYSSAGHPYGIRYNALTKEVEKFDTKNMVIGINSGCKFTESLFNFNVGDKIIMYTDGISEARNDKGEMYGDERFIKLIKENSEIPSKEFIEVVEEEIRKFTKKPHFDDDVTLIVIDIRSDKDKDEGSSKTKGFFTSEETNKLIEYYSKSIEIKKQENDKEGLVKNMRRLGTNLMRKGKSNEALNYLEEALKHALEVNDARLIGDSYASLGSAYYSKGEVSKAIESVEKALEYYSNTNYKDGLANCYNIMAISYGRINDTKKQREYVFKALEIEKEREKEKPNDMAIIQGKAALYNNLGVSYHGEGNINMALEYYLKSLDIANKYDITNLQATLLNNIGAVYMQKADFEKALKSLHKSLSLIDYLDNKDTQSITTLNIGTIYFYQNEKELSLYYLKKGIDLTVKFNLPYNESILRTIRAENLVRMGKIEESIEDIKIALSINKKYNFDPSNSYIKTVVGILLYCISKESNILKKEYIKNSRNTIISYFNNNEDINYYFESAVEDSLSENVLDTIIPASREYVEYLYKVNPSDNKEKMITLLNRAYELAIKSENILEKNKLDKTLIKIGLKDDLKSIEEN